MKTIPELKKILSDKTSGSSEILFNLNSYFKKNINNLEIIEQTISISKKELIHFAVISNYLESLSKIYNSNNKNELQEFISSFNKIHAAKYLRLYDNAKPAFKNLKTVMTLSNSRTLAEVFKLWKKDNKNLKVIICESRPKNEGKLLAKVLLKKNIGVEIITDFMISVYIPKIDAVILGADAVLKNGNIVNKAGSFTAAALCRQFNKPCYVLAAKDKYTGRSNFNRRKQNPDEVWKFKDKNLTVTNIYFEEVPKPFITKIISD